MCVLLEKARKDYDVVQTMKQINDEVYLDICCYHIQQAIEKLLKCSIELKGNRYAFTHDISRHYADYINSGWDSLDTLELMSGTLTDWEAGSRYKESFFATTKQLETAISIYEELEKRLVNYLQENTQK